MAKSCFCEPRENYFSLMLFSTRRRSGTQHLFVYLVDIIYSPNLISFPVKIGPQIIQGLGFSIKCLFILHNKYREQQIVNKSTRGEVVSFCPCIIVSFVSADVQVSTK